MYESFSIKTRIIISALIIIMSASLQADLKAEKKVQTPRFKPIGSRFQYLTEKPTHLSSNVSCEMNNSPINLTNTPGSSFTRNGFEIDASGTIHVIFFDEMEAGSVKLDLFYIRSIDGGKTFSPPVRISTEESKHEFLAVFGLDLTLGQTGEIYVTWSAVNIVRNETTLFFSSSKDLGKSFTPPEIISIGITNADLCNIAIDKSGNILVNFIGSGNGIKSGLYMARSSNGGQDFSTPTLIDLKVQFPGSDCPALFDSKGAAYIVYHDILATPITVNVAIARDGVNFTELRTLVRDPIHALYPHIAIDKNDNIYVAYHHEEPNEVLVIKSTDGGRSFGQPANASHEVEPLFFPYLIVDGIGNVKVIMLGSALSASDFEFIGDGDVYLSGSTDGGLTFSDPVNASCSPAVSLLASGAADNRGNVFVTWIEQSSSGRLDLFAAPIAFEPAEPDFSIFFNPTVVTASRGDRVNLTANISRARGFSGNVIVNAAKTRSLKIELMPRKRSTTGANITFNLKTKNKIRPGIYQLPFSGRDDKDRIRTGTLTLFVE
jgi:hypothetical protein